MSKRLTPFQTLSDERILFLLTAHDAIHVAFTNVRPTEALLELASKTLAWAERKARK